MGLGIPQEFWPITPIRTNPGASVYSTSSSPISGVKCLESEERMDAIRGISNCGITRSDVNDNGEHSKMSDLDHKQLSGDHDEEGGDHDDQCRTPKWEDQLLKAPVVCPPAPRKPRPAKRKFAGPVPSRLYFHVPSDLSSVFVPINSATGGDTAGPRKRIKAG